MSLSSVASQNRWVYSFETADGSRRDLLGGKGAELARMTSLGIPVPPGFTISTEACRAYFGGGEWPPAGLWAEVESGIHELEQATGRGFGDPANPLLVSVRSGAAISMPGMMDTVLNLGINRQIVDGIVGATGNERFALDLHRRFIQMYAGVVLGVDANLLSWVVKEEQRRRGMDRSADLEPSDLRDIIDALKATVGDTAGTAIPDDPFVQLEHAIRAVFNSWNGRRAKAYRDFHGIPHDLGTAVSIVTMVYGNMDESSGTGVLFTRDPSTGEKRLFGEYLPNAQGEDVVSGMATPRDISYLATDMPEVYRELTGMAGSLEAYYRDVQDVEFTVERGKLFILQTRAGKRSARAAVRTAVDLVAEGLITKKEAILRVEPERIYQLLLPRFDEPARKAAADADRLLSVGLGAAPGAATGRVAFDADTAAELGRQGVAVVLVRPETSAEDVRGMMESAGVLTARGGATSHAAVVARGLGKPCVTGAESIEVHPEEGYMRCGGVTVKEGDEISIDGASGEVFIGSIATVRPNGAEDGEMATLLGWADDVRRLGVWANADSPADAATARAFGAEGIGLCRTEHMFFEPARLSLVRDMILAAHRSSHDPRDDGETVRFLRTLKELEQLQTADFEGIFRAMDGRVVVIRLLDPPLHEFLPSHDDLQVEILERKAAGEASPELAIREALLATLEEMREVNPMLGLRGCRVGLVYPDIYRMQTRAIVQAAHNVGLEGVMARPEIMVPLVSHANEMRQVRDIIETTARDMGLSEGGLKIGVMIETPRAALTADAIAESAEFFSFGTNDLTQTTFAFSRDDAEGKFLRRYSEGGILDEDPFQVVDRDGVGRLVEIACELGRRTRPELSLGICGEHGGDPASIEFFHDTGLDYVSCSPYRVPVARLAAAQAALRSEG